MSSKGSSVRRSAGAAGAAAAATAAGNAVSGTPPVVIDASNGSLEAASTSDGDGQPDLSSNGHPDIFQTHDGQRRLLRGACIYSGSPRLAELAAKIGFETVWIEMEHG